MIGRFRQTTFLEANKSIPRVFPVLRNRLVLARYSRIDVQQRLCSGSSSLLSSTHVLDGSRELLFERKHIIGIAIVRGLNYTAEVAARLQEKGT